MMASATRILSTRVHEHKLLVPTVLSDARLMHRIRNRCGVQSQATPRRTSGGRAPVRVRVSRDCAHLAPAPAKRRNHLRKKSRLEESSWSSDECLPSSRHAPVAASGAPLLGHGQLKSLAGTAHRSACPQESVQCVGVSVCFCLLIPGQKRERAVTCLFHRSTPRPATARYQKIPRSTSHRPTQSPAGFSEAPNAEKCTQSFKDWHHEQQHGQKPRE